MKQGQTQKKIVERQREKFLQVIEVALDDVESVEGTVEALDKYLRSNVPITREGMRRTKHVFGSRTWMVLKSEEIMAFLAKQILKKGEKCQFLFPAARDWLSDHGFDQEGIIGRTIFDDLEF